MGCEKTTNDAIKFSYHFLLSDAQPDISGTFHQDFPHIAQARWKYPSEFQLPISVLISPVYITFEYIIKLKTHSKQHEFLHVYICFWYTFLTQKVNLTKEKILWPPIYTINVGTRKRLHDIPRFLILFLGQEILIIIYRTCNVCVPF